MSTQTLFGAAPYVAVGVALVVTALRHALRIGPEPRRAAATAFALFGGSRLWRAGLLGVAASHGLMLLAPRLVMRWNEDLQRLIAAEVLFAASGLAASVGLVRLLRAHLRDPHLRADSSLPDMALLAILTVLVVSGTGVAFFYRWASGWSVVTLAPYVRSLAALHPVLALVEPMPYLVRLHTFAATAFLMVLPFSHLVDVVRALVAACLRWVFGRVRSAAAQATRALAPRVEDGLRRARLAMDEDEVSQP